MADLTRKTANLLDESDFGLVEVAAGAYRVGTDVGVLPQGTYIFNADKSASALQLYRTTKNGNTYNYEAINDLPYSFTADGLSNQIFRSAGNTGSSWVDLGYTNLMLNTGATAKPYEPYGWVHSLRKLTTATEAIENPLYSDGTAITSYTLKGNTVQSGTPTPSNPVEVSGVGVRTSNLIFKSLPSANINASGTIVNDASSEFDLFVAKISQGTAYSGNGWVYAFYSTEPSVGSTSYNSTRYAQTPTNVTAPIDGYIVMRANHGTQTAMLNEGATALPFEPYGFKIPISSGGVTTNIYVSEPLYKIGDYADVINADGTITRNIGHIKLNTLTWSDYGTNQFASTQSIDKMFGSGVDTMLCDTYICAVNRSTLVNNAIAPWNSSTSNRLVVQDNQYSTAADWIAAMGDVGIWFILATPTTEQITLPAIATTEGANSITVDTTVQPSEFSATWTGWHDASVKEWDGNDWT